MIYLWKVVYFFAGDKDRELLDMAASQHTLKREKTVRRSKPRISDKWNRTPDFNLGAHRSWCSDGETSSQPEGLSSEEDLKMKEIQRKSKRRLVHFTYLIL